MKFFNAIRYLTLDLVGFAFFVFSALVIFVIFKIIVRIVDYFLFKKLILAILEEIVEDDESSKVSKQDLRTDNEDERLEERDIEKEKIVEVEKINQPQEDKAKFNKKVVGVMQKQIFGKWTEMVVGRFASKLQGINMEDLQNLGRFQAEEKARQQSRESGIGNQAGL